MNNPPFFSIIIPTLNEEKYLPKLLQALQKQTFKNFEIIILDADSQDKTVEIARSFSTKFKALQILKKKKSTLPHHRNIAASKTNGVFLVFLEADVTVKPQFLKYIYTTIQNERAIFLTTWHRPDTNNTPDKAISLLANISVVAAKLIGKPFSGGFNTIIRKDAFLKVNGYNASLVFSDDHDFAVRLHKAGYRLHIIKSPLLIYSMRRFRQEGRLKVLGKYATFSLYFILLGPTTKKLFNYPMGGHAHINQKKNHNLFKWKTYTSSLEKIHQQMIKFFSE